jgi:hypothetical protein
MKVDSLDVGPRSPSAAQKMTSAADFPMDGFPFGQDDDELDTGIPNIEKKDSLFWTLKMGLERKSQSRFASRYGISVHN